MRKPYRDSWKFRLFKMRVAVNKFLFRFTAKGREQRRQAIAHRREQTAILAKQGVRITRRGQWAGERWRG